MKTRFLITALIALVVPIHAAVYQPGGGGTGAGGAITGAYAFSAGFNVTQATNVALNSVLSNQVVTGISQGATNAGFYVGSVSGKGTNTQIFVSATVSGRFETTNGIVVFGDINNPNVMTNYNQFWMRAQLVLNDSGNSILIRDGAFLDLKSGGAIVMGSDSTTNRIQVGPNSYVTSPVGGSDNNEIYRYRFWADGGISALASNRVMRFWEISNYVATVSGPGGGGTNFLDSSENTHLFRPMQQRILTTNNALATPRILFAGDSLTGISDATFQNSPGGELVKQMNQIYNNGDWNPFGRLWVSFSGGANPAWIGTNWFGHNTWSLPTGTAVQFISYTNINLIQAAWIRQVAGNANLAIWTNNGAGGADALCATLEGFNATPQGAFTNIPVALGNYSVRFEQTGAALKTNVTIFISGQKTNSGGFASYFFATGGSTMTNFIAVPAAVKNPILSAIAPDVIIWEALDFTEVGGDQGYTNALNALYASLTNACGTSLVFGLVGVPNGQVNSGAYDQQNATARRMCQNQGWIYLDGTIPRSIYTNGLSDDTVHYNTNSAPIAGATMGVQLGLLPPMAPLGAIWANLQAKIAGNVGGGGGTPAGNSGAIQLNEGGAFAGTNSFIADRTNNVFRVSAPSGMPGISIELPGVGSNTFGFRQLTYNPGTGNTYDFLPSVNANGGFGLTSLGSIQPVTSNFMSAGTFLRPFSTNYANDYVAFETISTPLLSLTGNTNGSASFYDSAGTEYAQLVAINNIQTNNVHILWTNATSGVVVAQPNGTGTNQLQNIALLSGQVLVNDGTQYMATSNVPTLKYSIWTNYIQTGSNFVFSFNTNRYELKNQTNVIFTNIVEEATGSGADMTVHIHNTTGVTMGLVWPAYGPQHGYYLQTNINNPLLTTTTLASGQHGIASFTAFGTNIFATFTTWP